MAKLTLNTIGSRYGSIDALNANFDAIETALENTLSRDGTAPNGMDANFDMDSNRVINLANGINNADAVNLGQVNNIVNGASSGIIASLRENFVATAGQTVFNIASFTYNVGSNNLAVYLDGVRQYPNTSYTETDNNTITFSAGLHVGALVMLISNQSVDTANLNAALVHYNPAGAGAVATNVQAKLRQTVSVKDFGAVGDGVTDDFNAMLAAWNYCRPIGASLYFPAGTYLVAGERSFPFNQGSGTITSLLDCNNMTIYGDGPTTILKTVSVEGSDVLQLNGLKNFHIRNMQVQSVVTGSFAGSNGMSITGGFDNITVDNFWAKNLAYVDKTTYVDGGKAVSIQPPAEANPITMGSFKATNIFADGCVYGFGYEPDNDLALTQPVSIEVDIVVSNSRQGVVLSSGAATSTLSARSHSGVRIRGQSINCMQDIVCGRTFGVDVDMQITQTKTDAQLLLSYKGTQWTSVDGVADVIGFICTYAKNSRFVIYGNKKDCRHKAKIGGASEGSSGINGATDQCDFYLDITGTSTGVDVQFNDSGGNIMNNSRLYVTTLTAITLPIEFYTPALDNTITIGPDVRLQSVAITGQIGWTETDGRTVHHNKYLLSGNLSTRQTVGSSADLIVEQWTNHNQARLFAIRNDGAIIADGRATAASVTTVNSVLPIYNASNVLVGYVPIYTTYA